MSTHYQSPLSTRYASEEMSYLFSQHYKILTWRSLWIALAKAQKQLGINITDAQIAAMESGREKLDFDKVKGYEEQFRHDVMAHVHAFSDVCPEARGIIHLGATSCYVTDNADLLQMREGLRLLREKTLQVIRQLRAFSAQHAATACLSYTHLQPAQPTTVGKRATLWIQDLLLDIQNFEHCLDQFQFLGVKGATGTQASFLALFQGDHQKVKELEVCVAEQMQFERLFPVSGQTYSRKQDISVLFCLSSLAASTHKCATDIRLLSHLKEIEEPFADKQVGSSAMPHKRNPMRSERICGIARYLISLNENPLYTEATQWFERTLDDSANRRLYLPEAFLCADALLNLLANITAGLIVNPNVIAKNLKEELPFLATEHILIEAAKKGKDRQLIHERLREHSHRASHAIKEEGKEPTLIADISQDPEIGLTPKEIEDLMDIKHFIGRSIEQTHEFLEEHVDPVLLKYPHARAFSTEISL